MAASCSSRTDPQGGAAELPDHETWPPQPATPGRATEIRPAARAREPVPPAADRRRHFAWLQIAPASRPGPTARPSPPPAGALRAKLSSDREALPSTSRQPWSGSSRRRDRDGALDPGCGRRNRRARRESRALAGAAGPLVVVRRRPVRSGPRAQKPFANQRSGFQTAPWSAKMEVFTMRYLAVVLALAFGVGTMAVAQACPDTMKTASTQVASRRWPDCSSEHQGADSDAARRLKRIGASKGRR